MAPTEGSTITRTDTAGEIISTITTVSTLWREEMNGAMQMTREELLRMERNHTKVMSVMRQMTDQRIGHVTREMRDIGQCHRTLLQANGEAVSQVNNTVRWNTNKTEMIRDKMDFIFEHLKSQIER